MLSLYPVGHTRIFTETLQLSTAPLSHGGAGQVYRGTSRSGLEYCVKLARYDPIAFTSNHKLIHTKFKPYLPEQMEWDRSLLSKRKIWINDTDLDTCFNLWHRESRAYEHVDRVVNEPMRSFFPKYYGTLELAYTACPKAWRCAYPEHGKVGAIVLELLSESRPWPTLPKSYRSILLPKARQLYCDLGDVEYVHIFIHLSEAVETLHGIGVIHGDVQADNISHSVLFDFSKSWVFSEGLPSIDQGRMRTLKDRQKGELAGIYDMVKRYYYSLLLCITPELTLSRECRSEVEQSLRTKFPSSTECGCCREIMVHISSASISMWEACSPNPLKVHSMEDQGWFDKDIVIRCDPW